MPEEAIAPERFQLGTPGEIISESRAISFRNRGRLEIGMVGDLARNQHAWRLVEKLIKLGRRNTRVDTFGDELEGQLRGPKGNEDLDFLSKVSRVATLRQEKRAQ